MRRTISSLKNVEIPWTRFASAIRRNGHGGTPWARTLEMSQPQDGALGTQAHITEINTHLNGGMEAVSFMDEPEDAQITGGTRSLNRRLTGLNIIPRKALAAKPVQSVVVPVASQSQVA